MTDIELLRFSVQSKEHLQYLCAEWAENTLVYHLASELLKTGELLDTERQKVKELSSSEWNLAGELVALQGNEKPVAYAVRNHFWKGGRANFQGKYHDLHFAENLKSAWDVQIPLFTTQPARYVVLPARFKPEISKVELFKGAPVMQLDPAGRWLNRTAVVLALEAAGMVVKDGE